MSFPTPETVATEIEKPNKECTDFVNELGKIMGSVVRMRNARSIIEGITTYTFYCGENLSEFNQSKIAAMLSTDGWSVNFKTMASQHSPSVTVILQPTSEVLRHVGIRA